MQTVQKNFFLQSSFMCDSLSLRPEHIKVTIMGLLTSSLYAKVLSCALVSGVFILCQRDIDSCSVFYSSDFISMLQAMSCPLGCMFLWAAVPMTEYIAASKSQGALLHFIFFAHSLKLLASPSCSFVCLVVPTFNSLFSVHISYPAACSLPIIVAGSTSVCRCGFCSKMTVSLTFQFV